MPTMRVNSWSAIAYASISIIASIVLSISQSILLSIYLIALDPAWTIEAIAYTVVACLGPLAASRQRQLSCSVDLFEATFSVKVTAIAINSVFATVAIDWSAPSRDLDCLLNWDQALIVVADSINCSSYSRYLGFLLALVASVVPVGSVELAGYTFRLIHSMAALRASFKFDNLQQLPLIM